MTTYESAPRNLEALEVVAHDTDSIPEATVKARPHAAPLAPDYLERIAIRFLQDSLATATRGYWHRRADELEWCRPRRGDFHGHATTRESLQARWDRLTLQAEQCRIHGDLFAHDTIDAELIAEILGWSLVPEGQSAEGWAA